MKALIGRYFTSLEKAFDYYDGLSDEMKEHQCVCEVGDKYFILADSTVEKFNKDND